MEQGPTAGPPGPDAVVRRALAEVERLVAQEADGRFVLDAVARALGRIADADAAWLVHVDPDAPVGLLATWSSRELSLPVGSRQVISDELRRLAARGRPYRVDLGGPALPGPLVAEARRLGLISSVGVPVRLAGRVWALAAVARSGPDLLPEDTEIRLATFAGPVTAALSHAWSSVRLEEARAEQAALRRLADLAAAARPDTVLAAVVAEASGLVGGRPVVLARVEQDRAEAVVAAAHGVAAPAGPDLIAQVDELARTISRTGNPVRVDDQAAASTGQPDGVPGVRAAVAVPVEVDGRGWGVLAAASPDAPLPVGTEELLSLLAQVAARTLSNAQTREELQRLADEQAALRRVAELVAREFSLPEVFAEITVEAARLLGVGTALLRFDPDGYAEIVAAHRGRGQPGLRIRTTDEFIGQMFAPPGARRLEGYLDVGFAAAVEDLGLAPGVAVPILVEGRTWGALKTSPSGAALPPGADDDLVQEVAEKLEKFAGLAAAAIANAENRAQLTASRARIVAAGDEARRRLQRDVHDGAQQRLVQTVLTLKLARSAASAGRPTDDLVEEALGYAERATAELRDLVHGILPASLSRGGLRSGIESLVAGVPLPVEVHFAAPRLSAGTEITAYFVVAEALTNIVKHARATRAVVRVGLHAGRLTVEVHDNGVGGADIDRGSGLRGLADRVETAEGELVVRSAAGEGTTLRASFPATGP